jgi:hypothetical protein
MLTSRSVPQQTAQIFSALAGQKRPGLRFWQIGQCTDDPPESDKNSEYHAMMTLLWNRRAAITSKSVPMTKSASASVQRWTHPAPRRMMPRVMLMK